MHPADIRLELRGTRRKIPRPYEHVAARDVELVGSCKDNGFTDSCFVEWPVEGLDCFDSCGQTSRKNHYLITRPDCTGRHRARVSAEALVRTNDVLHWKSQIDRVRSRTDVHGLEPVEQWSTLVPWHIDRWVYDVVAFQG